jgi:hypothetical protein
MNVSAPADHPGIMKIEEFVGYCHYRNAGTVVAIDGRVIARRSPGDKCPG